MLLGVDIGGTFTDAVLVSGSAVHTVKVPTTPSAPAAGVLDAIFAVLERAGVQARDVDRFAHGMTVATNALLEGRWARTALVATEGFTDVVELARQARPHLYRLCEAGPAPLAGREMRFGAPERMGPGGVLRELDGTGAAAMIEALADQAPEAVAVTLLHSYAHPEHEQAMARLIGARLPNAHVSLSHELVGTFREYERAATTEVDAALSPLLAGYLGALCAEAQAAGLPKPEVMQSSGGLIDAARAAGHAALTVLSGPAGGVRGAQLLARHCGDSDVLCFDMGGTSCDVCVIADGEVAETAERSVGGRPLALPALDIHTVGAGGGSIAWRDAGGALRVGPQSAGAVPGPACYGRGGSQPTVTDANLVLRRLDRQSFPGGVALDVDAATAAVAALADSLQLDLMVCAEGIVAVAEAEMLRALRVVTVERGVDPRRFSLLGFGGAGPLHATAIAEALGIGRVLCPRAGGVLSALGLAVAPARRDVSKTVMLAGRELEQNRLAQERDALIERACRQLGVDWGPGDALHSGDSTGPASVTRAGTDQASVQIRVRYELRYAGQAFELAVEENQSVDPAVITEAFIGAHEERYGYRDDAAAVQLVTIRVSASIVRPQLDLVGETEPGTKSGPSAGQEQRAQSDLRAGQSPGVQQSRRRTVLDGHSTEIDWIDGQLPAGMRLEGPAVCAMPGSTLLVRAGWSAEVDTLGTVVLTHTGHAGTQAPGRAGAGQSTGTLDPIELQVLTGALHATCEEMGAVLVRSAHSANIKERRDASTALFDGSGQMVMQAEHIPVHLGAMPDAIAAVLGERHEPGVSFILNDPFAGGTHLPDITVITPVFGAGRLVGFAASRAHHADVGGRWPGSMPADSRTLSEEGLVISPQRLDAATIERLVTQMRQPEERRADLRAQLAANRVGAERLAELARRLGPDRLRAGTDAVLDYTERRIRTCLEALERDRAQVTGSVAEWHAQDVLEAGEEDLLLRLRATIRQGKVVLDFTGSAPQHSGNLNCPMPVTRSACYFAMRVLTDPDVPASAGAHRPIEVIAPLGCLLNARPGAAVAAGNVETSSRVADLVLAAFGRALGQGTMNNLTLGNDTFTYYETVGGGQGACADADGPSAVHVAMSNTSNTPVEALERDLPLRVRRYSVRRGSGGAGHHRGGDGVVREIEALGEMAYSLIGERRRHSPPGAKGGAPGAPGRSLLVKPQKPGHGRETETAIELPAKSSGTLAAGQRLRVETPGGGGYGEP